MVITHTDEDAGWWEGSLYTRATNLGYTVSNNSEEVLNYDVDYIVSTLYYDIIDSEVLNHSNLDSLNLHLAELPRYRGSNVFTHAILNAREDDYWKYGVTLHSMTKEVDAGDIVSRSFLQISEEDTAKSLYKKAEDEAVSMFEDLIHQFETGTVHEEKIPQTEFDGKRYYYERDSIEALSPISNDQLMSYLGSESGQKKLFDLVRALHFPPHDPLEINLNGDNVFVSAKSFEEIIE